MKRKTLVKVTIIFLAVVALFFIFRDYFIPQQIVKDDWTVEFIEVKYLNDKVAADTDKIVDLLKNYHSIKSFKDYFPNPQAAVKIEINMVVNHKPIHLLLGDFNVWYESAD